MSRYADSLLLLEPYTEPQEPEEARCSHNVPMSEPCLACDDEARQGYEWDQAKEDSLWA